MKPLFPIVVGIAVLASLAGAAVYDEYGIWKAANEVSIAAGNTALYGPVSAYDRETVVNIGYYGTTSGDSLIGEIKLYGGFSPALSDSAKYKLLKTGTFRQIKTNATYSMSDTIDAESKYPYLMVRFTNNHASAAATVDLFLFSREQEKTIIRMK